MSAQFTRLGAFLKERREKSGTALQDVETATSIRLAFLEAIEEGSIEELIDGAYARGFIKQYANFLGVDGERALREISRGMRTKPGDFHYGIGSIERRRETKTSSRLVSRLVSIALILLAGGILWQLLRRFATG